ncbi:MAG: ABC transporter permease, partial [Acidobacteria bacterium]|nr:ABC transporter permease [Acidobacteriota bacterium]
MSLYSNLRATVSAIFRRSRAEAQMEEELRAHIQNRAEDLERSGLSPAEAVRRAQLEFGGYERFKEECRQERGGFRLETLLMDVRYGARLLRRSPGFAAIAILTLALGIGANTAIFSVVHAVLLRPLPYPHADRLTIVWSQWGNETRGPASGPELIELRRRSKSFEEIGGIWTSMGTITEALEPEQVRLGFVTANFLPLMTQQPEIGRLFLPGEDRGGSPAQMILTDGLWRRQFGANPNVIGKPARLNGNDFTIIGVLPPDFHLLFPDGTNVMADVQVFITFHDDLEKRERDTGFLRLIGRLRRGVTVQQAQNEAETIAAQLRQEAKEYSEQSLHLTVASLQREDVSAAEPALIFLFAAVGLVLLVTCANVANLLLARASNRNHEAAMRKALGAGQQRIVRQLLTENLLLGLFGGIAALGIGWAALRFILAMQPPGIYRLISIQLNGPVLAFTLVLSLLTALLFGLAPALVTSRGDLVDILKGSGQSTTARPWLRHLLIVSEVSLGFVLLAGTGLMVRTFSSLLRVDPGFHAENVVTFQISFPWSRYDTATSINNFMREFQANLAVTPGTESVSAVSHLPFDEGLGNWYSYYWPEGAPA